MDAFTKGKPSYLCGTLGPIVLQHYIKDFWTAKTLHTFLNVVSKNGGVLYIRQCFCFCTAHSATEHQKVNIFVLERTRTENREANHVDLLQLWIQQQRGSVNGVDRGYKFPLASCQESIF
jgi:hypothetical protein